MMNAPEMAGDAFKPALQNSISSARRKIPLRRKLAFSFLCVLVTLLIGEAAIRARAWLRYGSAAPNVPDELLVFDKETGIRIPRPGAEQTGSRIHIKINSLGFRGDEFTVAKPPNTIRIACVGASTTFCSEVSDNDKTWPARLQSLLQARHPEVNFQVINAGVGGYVSTESLKNLQNRVLPLKPDLVIFYEANNDMATDTRDLARQRGIIAEGAEYRSPFSKFMSRHSLLYDLVSKNLVVLFSRRDSNLGKLDKLPLNLPDHFIGNLKDMSSLLSDQHIPFVLSCYLTKYRRDQPRDVQIANAEVAFYYMPWMTIDSLLDGMDLYNDAIVRFARSHKIPVVEDRLSVPADEAHFADFVHFRDAGCEAMAQRFAQFLDGQKLMEPLIAAAKQK